MDNDTLRFEIDDEATALELAATAKKLGLGFGLVRSDAPFVVTIHITDPRQAYDYANETFELMKRYEIDGRKRARAKQYDDVIAKHREFFEGYVAAYDKSHRYASIDVDIRKAGMVICAEMKEAKMFSYATTNKDILSNFYRHIKKNQSK